ncbi:MAG: AraC family transcriptional regulator [Hyphomicrobiaceae bacterium]
MFGGVDVMRARFVHHSFAPHAHEELMIGILHAGTKAFRLGRGRRFAGRGMLSVVNAGEMHTGERHAGDELEYAALYLSQTAIMQIVGGGAEINPEIHSPVIDDPVLWRALNSAQNFMMSGADALAAEEMLTWGVTRLFCQYGNRRVRTVTPPYPDAVKRAVSYIHAESAEPVTLDAIAQSAAVGRFHLIRLFQRHLGLSPHAYVTQVRIDRGKLLLRAGETVANVALDVGFADQAHFTKRFKQLTGATPAQYASACRH